MSLRIKIKKDFGAFILDVEFEAKDETIALLGASGSGKSLTLKCIAGIITPDEGEIILNGITLFSSEKGINLSPQKRNTGYLFQNFALFPNMTVEENISTGIREKLSREDKKKLVAEMTERFHLQGLEKSYINNISGGQQQRVALARILISKPQIIMLDEPFSALDSYLRRKLELDIFTELKKYEGTIILVSHNRDEVFRLSDTVAVIASGSIEVINEKKKIFTHPITYNAALLTGCKNISSAQRIDNGLLATEWGLEIPCEDKNKEYNYVGIRAKAIVPAYNNPVSEDEFAFEYTINNIIEDTFNYILMISPADNNCTSPIMWEIPKNQYDKIISNNTIAKIKKQNILFLK